jgi:hypothetical protein
MCNAITFSAEVAGSGKGANGWFSLQEAQVYFDHPFHAPMADALMIDFRNPSEGPSARVAVELNPESARELARLINEALAGGNGH